MKNVENQLIEYLVKYKRYTERQAASEVRLLDPALWEAIRHVFKLDLRKELELPWSTFFNRCKSRLEPNEESAYFGRCNLKRHSVNIDHALERGMETPRWSTKLTG